MFEIYGSFVIVGLSKGSHHGMIAVCLLKVTLYFICLGLELVPLFGSQLTHTRIIC